MPSAHDESSAYREAVMPANASGATATNKRPREHVAAAATTTTKRATTSARQDSKDVRTGEIDEPCPKMARSEDDAKGIHNNASRKTPEDASAAEKTVQDRTSKQAPCMPHAPTLGDFFAPGGSERYLPRPEWLAKQHPPHRTVSAAGQAGGAVFAMDSINDEHEDTRFGMQVPPPRDEHEDEEQPSDTEVVEQVGEQRVELDEEEDGDIEGLPDEAAANRPPQNGLLPENVFQEFRPPSRPPSPSGAAAAAAAAARLWAPRALTRGELSDLDLTSLRFAFAFPSARRRLREEASSQTTASHLFGDDRNTALHVCIREGAVEAAIRLVDLGADIHAENNKGVTPLLVACQKGLLEVVDMLIDEGASIKHTAENGSTALLQASHFGHLSIVQRLLAHEHGRSLIDKANHHNTTALMRASQEGHGKICSLLLLQGADVNRHNNELMTALMLASQRGHADVVRLLVRHRAQLNAKTSTAESTALILACKRGHVDVVKVLVGAGCELQLRDNRGRTARAIASKQLRHVHRQGGPDEDAFELVRVLSPEVQVEMMKRTIRVERNHTMAQLWSLLQQERAWVLSVHGGNVSIHEVANNEDVWSGATPSVSALIGAMRLPQPMVELVASYIPLPDLWELRCMNLRRQCDVDADVAVHSTLDLIDECLEAGGFVEACAAANVTPPSHFSSWADWKLDTRRIPETTGVHTTARQEDRHGQGLYDAGLPALNQGLHPFDGSALPDSYASRRLPMSTLERRREVCFLQILAYRSPILAQTLISPPYRMPALLVQKLIAISDVQSLARRLGSSGVNFQATLASQLTLLSSHLIFWCRFSFAGPASLNNDED